MVIVGGSGNNFGAVLGGFLIWFLWVQVEPMSQYLVTLLTAGMAEDNAVRLHMMESVGLYAFADHGVGFVAGSALQSTWVDPREVDKFHRLAIDSSGIALKRLSARP
jgi:hypothetical protein